MRHFGESSIRIGLEHPFEAGMVIGVAELHGRALCASAINRRAWGSDLHHVLDARTGSPVRDVVATCVVADEAATADGLATALFFVGHERLIDQFDFAFVRMYADGRLEASRNFEGELFT
jgi:thiamine biosynthesis lipoprotein